MNNNNFTHNHEVQGLSSVNVMDCQAHAHRYNAVTRMSTNNGRNHTHEVEIDTVSELGHMHCFKGRTGPAIQLGNDRHVHCITGNFNRSMGHNHQFTLTTMQNSHVEDSGCCNSERNCNNDCRCNNDCTCNNDYQYECDEL